MNCPRCTETSLLLSSRDGVEIDYCPKCRGVWLDRGELDKIIERAELAYGSAAPVANRPATTDTARPYRDDDDDDDERRYRDDDDDSWRSRGKKKKKRGGFLSEIFELGG